MRRILCWIFIVIYLYGSALWLAAQSSLRTWLLTPVTPLFTYLGLWQEFTVFSPNPRTANVHITAHIIFDDGSGAYWEYPRIEKAAHNQRMFYDRARKFGIEHLNWEGKSFLWPDFARYVARIHESPQRKPRIIQLIRHYADIPPPEKGLGKPNLVHNESYVFYTLDLSKERVR